MALQVDGRTLSFILDKSGTFPMPARFDMLLVRYVTVPAMALRRPCTDARSRACSDGGPRAYLSARSA